MKILWIVNILFPEAQSILDGSRHDLKMTGGWMVALSNSLSGKEDIRLYVASLCSSVHKITLLRGEKISYYLIPYGKGPLKYNSEYEGYWKQINLEICPDVVHIHGTELTHGLAYVKACDVHNVVVSIQGLTSVYARYHHSGIGIKEIIHNLSLRDIIQGSTIIKGEKNLISSGIYEKELIRSVKHVIGRTSWDHAHTWVINKSASYHFCNETLRHPFYTDKWRYDQCVKQSVFLSQAGTSIKGLYLFLKALNYVLEVYPDIKVRIAGNDITKRDSIREKLAFSGYCKLIGRLLRKNNIRGRVTFLGPLDANAMKTEYLRANVFVSPSAIENSPNSLGEAQLLGVPCIASYVGGVHDMIPDSLCGVMYRYEEYEMLAHHICETFSSSSNFNNTHMREIAFRRHDPQKNLNDLLLIYKIISNQ